MNLKSIAISLAIHFFPAANLLAQAHCVLPLPDGGRTPSVANLRGSILSVDRPVIRILDEKSLRPMSVHLPSTLTVYTAFGGDASQEALVAGQYAWVWYERCRSGGQATPKAAYFQIYSQDPNDQPKARKPPRK